MGSMLFLAAALASTAPLPAPATGNSITATRNGEFLAKNYPPEALKRGEQGKVVFALTIENDGTPIACEVTESSGFATLDRETCELLVLYGRMAPTTDANGNKVRATKTGHITWKLPNRALAMASTAGMAAAKSDRIVCRRSSAPGSIIKKIRRCMTQAEWKTHDSRTMQAIDQATGAIVCGDHGC